MCGRVISPEALFLKKCLRHSKVALVEVSRRGRARKKPLTITNQGLHGRLKPSHHSKGEPEHIEAVITKMMHPIALEYPQGHMLTHSNIQSASNQ